MSLNNLVKRLQDIMRNDAGINGDAQRIEQMVWILFLKVYDAKEEIWEFYDEKYTSIIPEELRWRNWAVDHKDGKALTGDALLNFVNGKLFPTLKSIEIDENTPMSQIIVRNAFEDNNNYMKDGILLRQVINVIDEIDFEEYEDRHAFGEIYETILRSLQSAGNSGEFYTPRAVTDFMVQMIKPKLGESIADFACGTIEFIKRKPYGNNLLVKVKDEVKLVIDATPGYAPYDRQKIIEHNKKNTVRHAYFREYLALQRLCLLILRHQKHQIGTGSRRIYGILFDGAWLWEEYINLLIEDTFYHPMNKSGTGAQRLFNRNVGLIYPDFISRNSEARIIADAKYKPIDNIGNRDYLQVLAYMFRFDARTGYYLYPEAEGTDDLKLWMNRGSTYEKNVAPRDDISITKHGLKIPIDVSNYDEFVMRMKICEQEFKSTLTT